MNAIEFLGLGLSLVFGWALSLTLHSCSLANKLKKQKLTIDTLEGQQEDNMTSLLELLSSEREKLDQALSAFIVSIDEKIDIITLAVAQFNSENGGGELPALGLTLEDIRDDIVSAVWNELKKKDRSELPKIPQTVKFDEL